jgi:hypothetical protein
MYLAHKESKAHRERLALQVQQDPKALKVCKENKESKVRLGQQDPKA